MADRLATTHDADAMLFLMERPTDWARLRQATGQHTVLLAGDNEDTLEGAGDEDFDTILLNIPSEAPVYERLTQALLEAVSEELLPAGASVVAVYSGFEPTVIDSLSIIRLGEHLGQLTVRDLRQLKTRIPLDTLKTVVDLAVDVGDRLRRTFAKVALGVPVPEFHRLMFTGRGSGGDGGAPHASIG